MALGACFLSGLFSNKLQFLMVKVTIAFFLACRTKGKPKLMGYLEVYMDGIPKKTGKSLLLPDDWIVVVSYLCQVTKINKES